MKEYLKRAVLLAAAHWGEIEMQEVSAGWKDTKDVYFAVESCNVKLHCTFNVPHIVRLIPILFAGSLALFCLTLATALPVSAQSVSLHGNVAPDAIRLSPVAHADPAKILTLTIQFVPRNQAEVNALIAAQQDPRSPQYHKWLTPSEYTRRFGPSEQDFNALGDWLKSSGFQITGGSRPEGVVKFSGTVATVEKAFNTKMMTFRNGSQFANTTEPEIPAAFADIVGEVTGLQNLGRLEPVLKPSRIHGLPLAKPASRLLKNPKNGRLLSSNNLTMHNMARNCAVSTGSKNPFSATC